MTRRLQNGFAALVAAQALHSWEECWFRLWERLLPARLVSRVFSSDPALGFLLANVALVTFGVWTCFARVRTGHPAARTFVWGWALVEMANGAGHLLFALAVRGYFPGALTAPLLLAGGAFLARELRRPAPSNLATVQTR